MPSPIENLTSSLFSGKHPKPEDDAAYDHTLEMFHIFLEYGDLFLFSNPRQLDFWTGYAFGARTIHLSTYHNRPIYDRFIYAPMGIDTKPPIIHTKDVIKGVIPGISKKDKVLLWTGGIWGHFDGQVLIKAMKLLEKERPDIKLVFFGTKHPNPSVPEMKESFDTRKLAEKLGLNDKTVFFLDGWVKYPERVNYLLEADVAVNTHKDSIESEFSHRTRVLDHILVGLPTISTNGDYFSDAVIKAQDLGATVPPGDASVLKDALIETLNPKRHRIIQTNISKVRHNFDWEESLKELKDFLLSDPQKLPVLEASHKLKPAGRLVRAARKTVPVPAKKMVVRAMRLTGLK